MSYGSATIGKWLPRRQDRKYPRSWWPKPGDCVAGRVVEFGFAPDKFHGGGRVQTCTLRQDDGELLTVWLNLEQLKRLFLAHWPGIGEEIELTCLDDEGRFLMIASGKTVTLPRGAGSCQTPQEDDRLPTIGPVDPATPPKPDEDVGSIADSI